MVHVGDVVVSLLVAVVVQNYGVEEVGELGVGVLAACIDSNAGVRVLRARKNGLLKRKTKLILLVLILVPNVSGQVFA